MITKRIELRNVQMSSFSKLVNYITNSQGKNERVGEVRVSNCESENPEWAAIEAEAVQAKNKRSKLDKTYHLLVSFREGDHPTPEVIQEIETRICDTLGYSAHQRVSAVHYDTDHMHIHIAINKIHPLRFTAHEPYFDKKNLATLCETLEKDYGLAADNHVAKMTAGEAKAQDMEKAAGIESLIGWIKRGCLPELLAASSWEELHKVFTKNGLQLSARGNGLAISDKTGIAAKASSVARALSKNALEKKLGAFRPAVSQAVTATAKYEPKPVASRVDTRPLWTLYEHEKAQHKQRHAVLRERAKHRKDRRIEAAKKMASTKRTAIKLTKGRLAKTLLYRAVSESFIAEMRSINQDYREDQRKVYEKGKHAVWYDWLKAKAWEGNTEALDVLRNRYEREKVSVNSIAGETAGNVNFNAGTKIETVTKRGTVHHQIEKTVLRDDGKLFRLSDHVEKDVLEKALKMASQRFGSRLSIDGTEDFRKQAVSVIAEAGLNIVLVQPEMEAQRKALATQGTSTLSNDEAAARYIDERNDKRNKGIEILAHRQYVDSDAGKLTYAGVRLIEGKTLMLLQLTSEMLVLPIDDKTANHVQRLKVGSTIEVSAQGIVRTRSRKM